ncbi:MAG TPA: glutaredoxin domain-containing protein [Magnetospirillaceae bacterium]|nr:glutaredoxin domain-containing protein [Magnetospirillaceae bacterium]
MKKTITIYTTTTCAYCDMVKKWLGSKGLSYKVINMDEEPAEVRQKVIEMSGAMTVPVTVVEEEVEAGVEPSFRDITVGWNPAKLGSAVRDMVAA